MPVSVTDGNGHITIDDGNAVICPAKSILSVIAYYDKVRIQFAATSLVPTSYVEYKNTDFTIPTGTAVEIAHAIANFIDQLIITAVANYSALPTPQEAINRYYFCRSSQGTSWLPGSLGGTYYPSGTYYSDGAVWIYGTNPAEAGQTNTNTGTITDRFISPATLNNYSGWNKTKVGLGNVDNTSDASKPISTATNSEFTNKQNQINILKDELKSNSVTKYKELIYSGGNLITINVWATSAMLLKLYQTDLVYSGGNLVQKSVTRISGNFTYTTVYTNDASGNLIGAETI